MGPPSGDPGRDDSSDDDHRLRRTRSRVLLIAAAVGALIGWVIAAISGRDGIPVEVAWSGPITLLAAAAVLGCLAYYLHRRLRVQRLRIDDRQAVTWLALAKAAAIMGAVMIGGYAGFAIRFVPDLAVEAPRERVIRSAVAILGAVGSTMAALRIEAACQVPDSDQDDHGSTPSPS